MSEQPSSLPEILAMLRQQYGRNEQIPAEELAKYGYQKMEIPQEKGGGVRFVSVAFLHQESINQIAEEQEWLKKRSQIPFEVIALENMTTAKAFRRIPWEELRKLEEMTEMLDAAVLPLSIEPHWPEMKQELGKLLTHDVALLHLMTAFHDFIVSKFKKLNSTEVNVIVSQLFVYGLLESAVVDGDVSLYPDVDDDNDDNVLPPDKAAPFLRELEVLKARSNDFEERRVDFNFNLISHKGVQDDLKMAHLPQLEKLVTTHRLRNGFEFAKWWLAEFVRATFGDELDLAPLVQAPSVTHVLEYLQSLNLSHHFTAQVKELTTVIRAASIEEKQALSQQLKEAKYAEKQAIKLHQGLLQFFDFPVLMGEYYQRQINTIINFITRGRENSSEKLYLDGRIDSKRDRNPGKVSGDCTKNVPIPFLKPDTPFYNIKVLNGNEDHIGNIYLVVTTDLSNKYLVWHLDAIQIPLNLNWTQAIKVLLNHLAPFAQEKNVDLITVNYDLTLVSNYDFIRRGVYELSQAEQLKATQIKIPEHNYGKKYSQLQGEGDALIVWENPTNPPRRARRGSKRKK